MLKNRRPTASQLRRLYLKLTDEQIGALYGVTGRSVHDWRVKHGIARSAAHRRRYTLDVDFFAKIDTEERAYALGLLATDGYITQARKQIFLALQARDEHILHDLARAMGSSAPVRDKIAGGFPGSGPQKYICFGSRKMVSDLSRYGVVPAKSLILTYAKVPRKFERHYVRGLFDGDGSLHPELFYFLGTRDLIDGIQSTIRRETGIELNVRKAERLWRISGYRGSKAVLQWMYAGAHIFLHRKRAIFLEHWQ